ncbi:MAG: cobalamin B12-binding domain-containing protein [Thermodesulfobacteriota bacterium]|nr:cobalamin B12-binding domain-containing protein [Thermodesulfobacteriota bacterium]
MEKRKRVLLAKPGLDAHDMGIKLIARALKDAGAEVVYGGIYVTPEEITKTAVEEDIDMLGLSFHSSTHLVVVPKIMNLLKDKGRDDLTVVVGGCIPVEDIPELKEMGVNEVFGSGSALDDIVDFMVG